MKLRIKFTKHGALKFIGHLDVMRYFQKAIRRAGIDITYSAGFSPHQVMSFAAPLGIGLESNGEYMDIQVNSITTSAELMEALNGQMADGIRILEVRLLPENAGNAMASVAAAEYTVAFRDGFLPDFISPQSVDGFYAQQEIIVTKQTKKSETTFDMKPYIYQCAYDDERRAVHLVVDASSSGNIKPSLAMGALYSFYGREFDEYGLLVTREETYINTGTKESPDLRPLGSIGSDF